MADVFGNGGTEVSSLDNVLHPAEVTILGVGNVILKDEGFGVRVAEYLDHNYTFPDSVQIVDGGTLGIELTQYVTGTNKLLVIDSINGGAEPGTVFRFHNDAIMEHFQDKLSAHEVGIQDVLALLTVTGHKIPDVIVHDSDRNWIVLIEAVTSTGTIDAKRHKELSELFKRPEIGLVFVTAFPDRETLSKYISDIDWETEVWIAEFPTHIIHFNGERFLGPYE